MSPELKLIFIMAAVLLALGFACIHQWVLMYRAERQLQAEKWMRVGFYKAKQLGWLPEDICTESATAESKPIPLSSMSWRQPGMTNPLHQIRVLLRHYRRRLHVRLTRLYARRLQRATRIPAKGPDYFEIGKKSRF